MPYVNITSMALPSNPLPDRGASANSQIARSMHAVPFNWKLLDKTIRNPFK